MVANLLSTSQGETGVRVQVITGHEEARLIYLGVRHSMDLTDKPSLIIDVGGGSVEVISGNQKKIAQTQSLKLGAIRLKDQFLFHNPPTKGEIRNLDHEVGKRIALTLDRFKTKEV